MNHTGKPQTHYLQRFIRILQIILTKLNQFDRAFVLSQVIWRGMGVAGSYFTLVGDLKIQTKNNTISPTIFYLTCLEQHKVLLWETRKATVNFPN